MKQLFDVVAVDMKTDDVRIMKTNQLREDARRLAAFFARHLYHGDFFTEVPSGTYEDLDAWEGKKEKSNG